MAYKITFDQMDELELALVQASCCSYLLYVLTEEDVLPDTGFPLWIIRECRHFLLVHQEKMLCQISGLLDRLEGIGDTE